MLASSRLRETKSTARAQAVKKCELEEIIKVPFPSLLRKQIETHKKFCDCDLHDLERDIEKVIKGKDIHADSVWPNSVCIWVGKIAPNISEETLNSSFVFAGYEGRTKDALRDLLIAASYHENDGLRGDAYNGLCELEFPGKLNFLLSRLRHEKKTVYHLCHAIKPELKKHPRDIRRVVDEVCCILKSSGASRARQEMAILLLNIGTKKAMNSVFHMLAKEKDPDIIDSLLTELMLGKNIEFAKKENLVANIMKRHLKYLHEGTIHDFFMHVIPNIHDIEGFVSHFTSEERKELLRLGDCELKTDNYWLGYTYFKAACDSTFMEAEMLGTSFKYILLPKGNLITSRGRVNGFAIAVSEEVPEKFRLVVAFHEYVEGRTYSHEKAVKAELLAAQSLGLDTEYIYWATEQKDELDRFSVIDQE